MSQGVARAPGRGARGLAGILEGWRARADAPGVAAARFDRSGVIEAGGAGFADLAAGRAAHRRSAWLWFPVTKVLTAELLLEAEAAGYLDLADPVSRYLARFRPRAPGGGRAPIALAQLAARTSGLPNPPPLTALRAPEDSPTPGIVRVERFARWCNRLRAKPGAEAHYSNLGFVVLGEALAASIGRTYAELAGARLARLGLWAALDWTPTLAVDRATGYLRRGQPYAWLMELLGAGRARGPATGAFRA